MLERPLNLLKKEITAKNILLDRIDSVMMDLGIDYDNARGEDKIECLVYEKKDESHTPN